MLVNLAFSGLAIFWHWKVVRRALNYRWLDSQQQLLFVKAGLRRGGWTPYDYFRHAATFGVLWSIAYVIAVFWASFS